MRLEEPAARPLQAAARMSTRTLLLAALPVSLLLPACFGPVQMVPATQAPPPPKGTGWYCAEAVFPPRSAQGSFSHENRCHRTKEDCNAVGDSARRQGAQVGMCAPLAKAFCSATFTNESNAAWKCTPDQEECARGLGGMAGVPGTKQSECSAVN